AGCRVDVGDVAEELGEEVLDGYQAGDPSVLVDHERKMYLPSAELGEDVTCPHADRHEGRRTEERLQTKARRRDVEPAEVLGVEDADHVVAVAAVHGQAREAVLVQRGEE